MFTVEREIPWEELKEQVRATTLLNQPDKLPYADSDIELVSIPSQHFDDDALGYTEDYRLPVQATAKYVVERNLDFQDRLRQDLRQQGHDQLSLSGGLVLRNTKTDTRSVLVPPIIENTTQDGIYVLDGAHRIWCSRRRWEDESDSYKSIARPAARLITAIVVMNPAYPSYAKPNAWREIREVEEVPKEPAQKKDYRFDYPGGYKALYRDFSRLGSKGSRSPQE